MNTETGGLPLPIGRLPEFLCLGAQKSGTNTLHAILSLHPQVFLPVCQEVHYFTLHSEESPDWYTSFYQAARSDQSPGDFSPYYLFHPAAARRIQDLLPTVKMIVLLRDPVERAISGYFHSKRLGEEPLSIEEAFDREEQRLAGADAVLEHQGRRHHSHRMHSYLSRSRYEVQIRRYRERFDRSQILLVRSEDMFIKPESVWQSVLQFLSLEALPFPGVLPHRNRGQGEARTVQPAFRDHLHNQLSATYKAMQEEHGITWP